MSTKSKWPERIIIFCAFMVFAGIIVWVALSQMPKPIDDEISTPSFHYKTSSKSNVENNSNESDYQAGAIDINNATLEELTTLPGIGEKKAQAIIDYRNNIGPFATKEDIKNVSGIGDATFEKLRDLITVE